MLTISTVCAPRGWYQVPFLDVLTSQVLRDKPKSTVAASTNSKCATEGGKHQDNLKSSIHEDLTTMPSHKFILE